MHSIIQRTVWKAPLDQSSQYWKCKGFAHQGVHPNYRCVASKHIIMLCFHSNTNAFQSTKSVRSTLSITAAYPCKSYIEAMMRILLIVTYMVVEKEMEHKGNRWWIHNASIAAAEVGKKTYHTAKQCRNQACNSKLRLNENKVSQSVSRKYSLK